MELSKILKIGLVLIAVVVLIVKITGKIIKRNTGEFLTIKDGRNNKLLLNPRVPVAEYDRITTEYKNKDYNKYDNLFYKYAELLLDPLPALAGAGDTPTSFNQLNTSQRIYSIMMQMDTQIKNGGVYQFIWNKPGSMYAAREALHFLQIEPLNQDYGQVLKELDENADHFVKDRAIWSDPSVAEETKWKVFQDGRRYIPAGTRIEEYYYSEDFTREFQEAVVLYVQRNKESFGVEGN